MKNTEETGIADLLKKILYAGIGSASLAKKVVYDSSPRSMASEFVGVLLSKVEKSKDEIIRILAQEVARFLSKVDVSKELSKVLQKVTVHLNVDVNFSEKKGKPQLTFNSVRASKK